MQPPWQPRPGDAVVRRPRQAEIGPVHINVARRSVPVRGPASSMLVVYGFLVLTFIGTLLLWLPISREEDGFAPFLTALFSATSAITVTGLVVVDTASYWTTFGHVILLILAFIGGLGFMTAAAFLLIIVGQRIGMQSQLAIREGLGVRQLGGLPRLIRRIVVLSVTIQLIGTTLLFLRFYVFGSLWDGISLGSALWQSAFLGVSAFNNAGLVILPGEHVPGASLEAFRSDAWVLGIVAGLIILGALGYLAIFEVITIRRFRRFSLETKIVLTGSLVLLIAGTAFLYVLEQDNDDTIGGLSTADQIGDSFFNATIARTAGFSIDNFGEHEDTTNVVFEIMMFIGGASASTAGGIKLNTFALIVIATVATVRGQRNLSAFDRDIPQELARRALVIGALATFTVGSFLVLLTMLEDQPLADLQLEVFSAIGTVGVSTGVTPLLSDGGRIVISAAMFVGRFGPLTLALLMAGRDTPVPYRYATEEIRIG
ncbi:MAG: potassium transporter TrkG [Dehalococcoidia bacterium]|nr:potassium transporter TrkG [Dehalococcoidia bacterium]